MRRIGARCRNKRGERPSQGRIRLRYAARANKLHGKAPTPGRQKRLYKICPDSSFSSQGISPSIPVTIYSSKHRALEIVSLLYTSKFSHHLNVVFAVSIMRMILPYNDAPMAKRLEYCESELGFLIRLFYLSNIMFRLHLIYRLIASKLCN